VVSKVKQLLNASFKVTLNCLGLSRGGMGVLILIQKLAKYTPNRIVMNTILFDPVPGNLITSYNLDILHNTLATQCMDVSASKNLANVLAIYPHEPLPDLAFHAPIIPKYPHTTHLEQLVTLGCHQGALFSPSNVDCLLSYHLLCEYLSVWGTKLDFSKSSYTLNRNLLLTKLDNEMKENFPTIRYTHSQNGSTIVRLPQTKGIRFLNAYHKRLFQEIYGQTLPTDTSEEFLLQISEPKKWNSPISVSNL